MEVWRPLKLNNYDGYDASKKIRPKDAKRKIIIKKKGYGSTYDAPN